ncbi:hypothetical protein ACFYTQ_23210 [Nocardia sp. NPDC004068]|uniref:hypothetical protein n=1 Tax=Nocardia sp. NPDC004068 TaxID=3364303 RepID=UPI0036A6DC6F
MLDEKTLEALVIQLTDADPARAAAARDRLSAAGADAAGPLITALRETALRDRLNPRSDPATAALIDALQRLGDAAVAPLAAAMPDAVAADRARGADLRRELPWRIGNEAYVLEVALRGLRVDDDAIWLPLLRNSERVLRYRAVCALATPRAAAAPLVDAILPLVTDPDAAVANQAIATLGELGTVARERLRALSRTGDAGRALAVLAALGEWPALTAAERELVRGWVADRVAVEEPEPLAEPNGEFLGEWFAVSTGDRDAVVAALGLHEPMPVTLRVGWDRTSAGSGRVFVTPELNGWTLIFGHALPDREFGTLTTFLAELSGRFGAAQYFYNDYGAEGWALAEKGELSRLYIAGDTPDADTVIGPPHPAEVLASADLPEDDEPDGRPLCCAQGVAECASLDPAEIGPETEVRGYGLLAGVAAGWHDSLRN